MSFLETNKTIFSANFAMFCPSSDEKYPQNTKTTSQNGRRKKNRKSSSGKNKTKKELALKKKQRIALTMSSWAENFTVAATWQLKHQLAFWKAKAKSLEYENQILHDIIRKNCSDSTPGSSRKISESEIESRSDQIPDTSHQTSDNERTESDSESNDEEDDGDFKVSEEFIEFLTANAKFKEDARRERELLKAKMEGKSVIEELEAGPSMPLTSRSDDLKKLYGQNWEEIGALEMTVQTQFIEESDKCKPKHWPNIALNL